MNKYREADNKLASTARTLIKSSKVPTFYAVCLTIVFSIRASACSDEFYEKNEPVPTFEFYGEHCGPGHGTGADPIDELDQACLEHDQAYK